MKNPLPFLILLTTFTTTIAQPKILPERERAEVIYELLEDKMTNLLPKLMLKKGIFEGITIIIPL